MIVVKPACLSPPPLVCVDLTEAEFSSSHKGFNKTARTVFPEPYTLGDANVNADVPTTFDWRTSKYVPRPTLNAHHTHLPRHLRGSRCWLAPHAPCGSTRLSNHHLGCVRVRACVHACVRVRVRVPLVRAKQPEGRHPGEGPGQLRQLLGLLHHGAGASCVVCQG